MRKIDDDNSPFVKYKLKIIATKFNNLNGCFCYDQLCLEVLFRWTLSSFLSPLSAILTLLAYLL